MTDWQNAREVTAFALARCDEPEESDPRPGTYNWQQADAVLAALHADGIVLCREHENPIYGRAPLLVPVQNTP